MRGKLEYPKMIYKNNEISTDKANYAIVANEVEHAAKLKEWGDKSPAPVAKAKKKVETKKKPAVADSDKKTEEKPKRGRGRSRKKSEG